MFQKLKNITGSKAVAGMEIILLADNAISVNIVLLKREGPEVQVEKHFENIPGIEQAVTHLDKKTPLLLVIQGKGVLSKKIKFSDSDTLASLLSKVLPNASLSEFNIQYSHSDTEANVTVIRSNALEHILAELQKNRIDSIADCYLGSLEMPSNSPGIEGSANAVSAALNFFTRKEQGIQNSLVLKTIQEEYRQKKKFEMRGWTALATCFLLLLFNYFVFDNYWSKNNEINSKLEQDRSALERYEKLKAEFSLKKDFLEKNGLFESSRTSFYADRLAEDLPENIRWQELTIHPLKKKEAADESKLLLFEKKAISVSGHCKKSTSLNDWIKNLKTRSWIANVQLLDYKQDHAKEDGTFLLSISLK